MLATIEFCITSIKQVEDLERQRLTKVRIKYVRDSDIVGTVMELDTLFKRGRVIRFGDEDYKVRELIFDAINKKFQVNFLPIDTTTYKSYRVKEQPFNPEGWEEVEKVELSSTRIPSLPKSKGSKPKRWDEEVEDEGYDDDDIG